MKKYLFLLLSTFMTNAIFANDDVKTSEELREKYPSIRENSNRKENKKILCPFHRLLERAGLYDGAKKVQPNNSELLVSIPTIISATKEFGCDGFACGLIAKITSIGQLLSTQDFWNGLAKPGMLNLTRLHSAKGVSHDCGLTFAKGGTEVSDEVRSSTLSRLNEISKQNSPAGTLNLENLMTVKNEICKFQKVENTKAGVLEVELIFEYLGGKDQGYIEYDDVKRFLHAEMPLTKAKSILGF